MKEKESGFLGIVFKGAFISLVLILAGILIFAFIVKICNLDSNVIKAVNQFIKAIAIFFGCMLSVVGKHGFVKGLFVGLAAIVFTYLVFHLFGGGSSFGIKTVVDALFTSVIGAVSGIVAVNVKEKN